MEYYLSDLELALQNFNLVKIKDILYYNNNYYYHAINSICNKGNVHLLKFILSLSRLNNNLILDYGYTFLYLACENNQLEILKILLNDLKINPQNSNTDGNTCFHIACQNNHFEIVKYLLNHPLVNILIKNKNQKTGFDLTSNQEIKNMINNRLEFLFNKKLTKEKFLYACSGFPIQNNNINFIKKYLKKKIYIDKF